MKRKKSNISRRKKKRSGHKLLFLSLAVLLVTLSWYIVTSGSGRLSDIMYDGEKSTEDDAVSVSAYATGEYAQVYEYISSISRVENRGLEMKIGKNGYYQMQNNSKDRNINVLQLTDLHITGTEASCQKDILSIKAVYTLISRTQPDFIVLTGDVIFGYDGYSVNDGVRALNVICRVMDRIGIPWTWTFGNHDHDFFDNFSSDSIASMLSQSSTLKMYEDNSQVTGYTNGVFELYNKDGTLNTALILIDSGDLIDNPESDVDYDYIRSDQISWYSGQIARLNNLCGSTAKTMLFFHIPLQEYDAAWSEGTPVFGDKREEVYGSRVNGGLFSAALALGSTQAMFCGHDHLNDYGIFYQGIELVYGKSIDYVAYDGIEYKTEQRGATLISISSSGYAVTQIQLE